MGGTRESYARVAWYLRRPRLYRELLRRVRQRGASLVVGRADGDAYGRGREEAVRWCQAHAVDSETAVEQLTGGRPSAPFATLFAETIERSRAAAEACPAPMGGPGDLNLIYYLAEHIQARRVVETGVAYGWSSLALLLSLKNREDSRLVSIDMPYVQRGTDEYVGVVVPSELASQWTLLRVPDRDGLPRALRLLPELDMCHYDSDKAYAGRMWSYARLWDALREGGLFVSDDVNDDVSFRDFCAAVGREPVIVASAAFQGLDDDEASTKYVGVVVK